MSRHSFPKSLAPAKVKTRPDHRMCDVLQLQPAGAFLRQAYNLQPARPHSNPIAVVGSCTDIDEALRLEDASYKTENPNQDEPEDFLTSIRRGLDELAAEASDDEDDDSDDEGYYYQAKENTYYSPDQKLPIGFLDDGFDLSDTSTASSSQLAPWTHQEDESDSDDEREDLIFQLEM